MVLYSVTPYSRANHLVDRLIYNDGLVSTELHADHMLNGFIFGVILRQPH